MGFISLLISKVFKNSFIRKITILFGQDNKKKSVGIINFFALINVECIGEN